jgi:hypothetical protein
MESTLMKRLWFIVVIAVGMTACVEGNNPVQLLSARPRDAATCDPDEVALTRGTLNFNGGGRYRITFSLFSPIALTSGDTTSTPAGFYADEILLSYETRNPKISLDPESLPVYFVVPAGADPEESWLEVDLIGTEARKKLATAVPTYPDAMTLLSTVKVKGKLPSGKTVETNEVTYPIEISRGRACSGDTVPYFYDAEKEPCGFPGQDGYYDRFLCGAPPASGG